MSSRRPPGARRGVRQTVDFRSFLILCALLPQDERHKVFKSREQATAAVFCFSLTCFYELSNQAFINSACLLFSIPLPHAIYLKATQPTYTQCDIWGDALLNKSTHAAETRKTTHTLLAQELTKIANKCGVPTTCNESRLPYQDEGTQHCSRKRADMISLCNCDITPNLILDFHRMTHLVMDVTIGHTNSMQHDFMN